ncbi:hypothetical protein LCGC14_0548780 [marine sediment metagenome]|uniref:Uncharacterized protein n=1 Tax=marine sediment metagenome TaxID=412755 RepID=A0A0F9UYX0_9ZZZZ
MKCKQCVANKKALSVIKQKCEDLTQQVLDETRDPLDRAKSATQSVLYVEWLASNIEVTRDYDYEKSTSSVKC